MSVYGFNATDSEYGQISGLRGHVSERSRSVKFSKFLQWLTLLVVASQITEYLVLFAVTYFG